MDVNELKRRFGQRVRFLRRVADLTQDQLADATSFSTEYISRIERGVGSPSFRTIATLSSTLRVEPKELFDFSHSRHTK